MFSDPSSEDFARFELGAGTPILLASVATVVVLSSCVALTLWQQPSSSTWRALCGVQNVAEAELPDLGCVGRYEPAATAMAWAVPWCNILQLLATLSVASYLRKKLDERYVHEKVSRRIRRVISIQVLFGVISCAALNGAVALAKAATTEGQRNDNTFFNTLLYAYFYATMLWVCMTCYLLERLRHRETPLLNGCANYMRLVSLVAIVLCTTVIPVVYLIKDRDFRLTLEKRIPLLQYAFVILTYVVFCPAVALDMRGSCHSIATELSA